MKIRDEERCKGNTKDGYRLGTMKQAFMICGILQSHRLFRSAADIHQQYIRAVGPVSERTIARYLKAFEEIGIVETKKTGNQYIYRWAGWPIPLH